MIWAAKVPRRHMLGHAIPTGCCSKNSRVGRRSVTVGIKEIAAEGVYILIWSNDRGGAPALKHCAGAHKMDGLVMTFKLQAVKHCVGAAKMAGVRRVLVTVRI